MVGERQAGHRQIRPTRVPLLPLHQVQRRWRPADRFLELEQLQLQRWHAEDDQCEPQAFLRC